LKIILNFTPKDGKEFWVKSFIAPVPKCKKGIARIGYSVPKKILLKEEFSPF